MPSGLDGPILRVVYNRTGQNKQPGQVSLPRLFIGCSILFALKKFGWMYSTPSHFGCVRCVLFDILCNISIMRTSFFAGIAQLVERYLAKV